MNKGQEWFITICFTLVIVFLFGIRDRLKRIEEKIDKVLKDKRD